MRSIYLGNACALLRAPAKPGLAIVVASLVLIGCTNEPIYLPSPTNMEGGVAMDMDGAFIPVKSSLQIPVVTETMDDAMEREALQAKYPDIEVPYVRIGDLEVSVEWTVRNLTDEDGQALIGVNGANQFFAYDPDLIELGEADNEEIIAPDLTGDVPLAVPANGQLSGVFKEDDLREAAVDLDMITRGQVNPFAATLQIDKNVTSFDQLTPLTFDDEGEPLPQASTGITFPREAMAQLLRVDLVFKPDRHMVLDYTVRVRDVRHDLVHELGIDALVQAPDELQPLEPMAFTITVAPPTTP